LTFESRFGGSAATYAAFRPDHPPAIFERILSFVPAIHREVAMDLGAGTGKATRGLLEHFHSVIAVEADPLMAEKLREAAPRAEVRLVSAEKCEQPPATVDLVNAAASLHWMDVPTVIANVERWLHSGGIFSVYGGGLPETPPPIREIVRLELRERWRQFRDPRLLRDEFPQSILAASNSLRLVENTKIPAVVLMSARDFAGFWSSTSYGSAYARTLPDPVSYWAGLEERIRRAWPEEKFPVDFEMYLFIFRRD
jgi:SAM-dependent methyltransferase